MKWPCGNDETKCENAKACDSKLQRKLMKSYRAAICGSKAKRPEISDIIIEKSSENIDMSNLVATVNEMKLKV